MQSDLTSLPDLQFSGVHSQEVFKWGFHCTNNVKVVGLPAILLKSTNDKSISYVNSKLYSLIIMNVIMLHFGTQQFL